MSLDEETNSSDSNNDERTKAQVEQRVQLRIEIIDNDGDKELVVNMMARTLRQGTMWVRHRDDKVILLPGYMFTCKEDLLTNMREFCI